MKKYLALAALLLAVPPHLAHATITETATALVVQTTDGAIWLDDLVLEYGQGTGRQFSTAAAMAVEENDAVVGRVVKRVWSTDDTDGSTMVKDTPCVIPVDAPVTIVVPRSVARDWLRLVRKAYPLGEPRLDTSGRPLRAALGYTP